MTKLIGSASLTTTDSGTDLTTKGDVHGYSTSNTRIPVGDDDTVLTADSSEALGVKWATPAGGLTFAKEEDSLTSNFSTTSTSWADVTGLDVTTESSGDFLAIANFCYTPGSTSNTVGFRINHDGTILRRLQVGAGYDGGIQRMCSFADSASSDGTSCKPQVISAGNPDASTTVVVYGHATNPIESAWLVCNWS